MRDLIDGYFALRRQSDGLKKAANRFEALPWRVEGEQAIRCAPDGWELSVYRIEDRIEACVSKPDGTFSTYS
jgi:hypothetical protein